MIEKFQTGDKTPEDLIIGEQVIDEFESEKYLGDYIQGSFSWSKVGGNMLVQGLS